MSFSSSVPPTGIIPQRPHPATILDELLPLANLRWLQLSVLAALLVVVGAISFQLKFSVLDLDVWWHLRTGDWIVQHAAFPHTGILSRSAANRSWAAYSWGYEVLLSRFYAWFGLMGIGIYGTVLTLMVAFSVYWMVRRLTGRFWISCLLAAVSCYAFLFNMMPRPVFFSIALLSATLTFLLESQRSHRVQALYWLPLIFLLWANLHIQFVYGLAVVTAFTAANLVVRMMQKVGIPTSYIESPGLSWRALSAILGACFVATLIGPYSYHLYGVIVGYSRSHIIYSTIQELQPLSFRALSNYAELFLAAAAFFAIGAQKRIDLFKLLLLVMASVLAFRTMRDSWFLCVVAAACMADVLGSGNKCRTQEKPLELAAVFASVVALLFLISPGTEFNTRGLDRAISGRFPVMAVNFVRQNRVAGPLYNTFDWGGFLSWYLPEYPVTFDGRTDLYGDTLSKLLLDTQNGDLSYKNNPYLNDAGLVVLHRTDGLVPALEMDPRFRKVYQDRIAAVFVRQAASY